MAKIKSNINNIFKYLIDLEEIEQSPLDKIKFNQKSSPRKSRVILSEFEIRIILSNAKFHDQKIFFPFIYFIAMTGCRRSEIMNLKWQNIDLLNNLIHLRNTKNKRDRAINLSPECKNILLQLNQNSDYIFVDSNNNQLKRSKIQRMINKFKQIYPNGKSWNYHDLRHSFAYNYLKKGGNMYQLQKILGHSNIKMTVDLYGELDIKDIEMHSPYDIKVA